MANETVDNEVTAAVDSSDNPENSVQPVLQESEPDFLFKLRSLVVRLENLFGVYHERTIEAQAEYDKAFAAYNHPKAVEARAKAKADKSERASLRLLQQANVNTFAGKYDLQFIDITPGADRGTPGMTIAFSQKESGSNVYCVATALRNPKDAYDRLAGRLTAAHAFDDGRWIYVYVPKGINPKWYLRTMFAW